MISLGSPKAALAVVLLFFYNGLVIGVYAAAIPTLVQRFGLTPLQLSMLFVAIGVAAIASMQASGRLSDRFGGACSALGYLIAATGATLPVLLIGWSLVGLGIGMIAPQVYAVAGHTAGGRGLSVVVTFGYATFLIAPAIVGVVVQTIGIQRTMFLPAVLLSGLLLVARIMPGKEAPATELSEAH